jgi:hypothetical protein
VTSMLTAALCRQVTYPVVVMFSMCAHSAATSHPREVPP